MFSNLIWDTYGTQMRFYYDSSMEERAIIYFENDFTFPDNIFKYRDFLEFTELPGILRYRVMIDISELRDTSEFREFLETYKNEPLHTGGGYEGLLGLRLLNILFIEDDRIIFHPYPRFSDQIGGINIIIGKSDTHTFSVEGYPPEYNGIVKDYYENLYKIKLGYEEK